MKSTTRRIPSWHNRVAGVSTRSKIGGISVSTGSISLTCRAARTSQGHCGRRSCLCSRLHVNETETLMQMPVRAAWWRCGQAWSVSFIDFTRPAVPSGPHHWALAFNGCCMANSQTASVEEESSSGGAGDGKHAKNHCRAHGPCTAMVRRGFQVLLVPSIGHGPQLLELC